MSDGFQYGDVIFLGLIAVFVALRLRSMLGKNSGIDPREIWKQASRDVAAPKPSVITERPARARPVDEELVPAALKDNTVVADGLKAIKAADATFNTSEFVGGAKLAFEWVVNAFAKGDKDKLRALLSPERFGHFAADIDARAASGVTQENTLVAVLAADITEAALRGSRAQITVQFTSEQIHMTRDKDNNITSGDPSHIEKVIDVWTFERDPGSRDPNWKIMAT
jgi:predicted lipid-binding transport protein (Tim44 family)